MDIWETINKEIQSGDTKIKILTFFPTLHDSGASMCKSCLTSIKDYSKHDITFCSNKNISEFSLDDFDIIHIHQQIRPEFFKTKAKIIYNIHNFVLSCPAGSNVCLILNRFLDDPLTCLNCLGHIGIQTGSINLKSYIKLAQRADLIAVHSSYMQEYYHNWDPTILPLPLETDILTPIPKSEREEYLLYSGRLSFEKNPYGFVEIINKTGLKGKMILYEADLDITNTKSHHKEFLSNIKNNPNIEVIFNPQISEMIELVKHAKFTVLPYFFAEPFGIAAANSVLCGTPLITFPYGNLRNMTHLLPKTLDEMCSLVQMNKEEYERQLRLTLIKSDHLRQTHNPKNAIKIWDETYEKLGDI